MPDHPDIVRARTALRGMSFVERAEFMRNVASDLRRRANDVRAKADDLRNRTAPAVWLPPPPPTGGPKMPTDENRETREQFLQTRAKISPEHLNEVRRVLRDPGTPLAWKRMLHSTTKAALEAIGEKFDIPDEPLNDPVWKSEK
jgi:hypothetical protein